jgi:hypothetical protein
VRSAPYHPIKAEMAAIHVLDNYYLAITFLITVAYQLFFFSIAFTLKFDKLTDFAGGTNFVLLAILTLAFSENRGDARNIVASVFIMVWAARLSGFLLFRILKTGKDDRFDDKRVGSRLHLMYNLLIRHRTSSGRSSAFGFSRCSGCGRAAYPSRSSTRQKSRSSRSQHSVPDETLLA